MDPWLTVPFPHRQVQSPSYLPQRCTRLRSGVRRFQGKAYRVSKSEDPKCSAVMFTSHWLSPDTGSWRIRVEPACLRCAGFCLEERKGPSIFQRAYLGASHLQTTGVWRGLLKQAGCNKLDFPLPNTEIKRCIRVSQS